MAAVRPPMGGFANDYFVFLNGVFWHLRKNRRYVQAHAWLLEFSQILLECIRKHGIPSPKWIANYQDSVTKQWVTEKKPLEEKGPPEIISFCETNSRYIASADPVIQFKLKPLMLQIRRLRNHITHDNIKDSQPLIDLLGKMKEFCELSPIWAQLHRDFADRCKDEIENATKTHADLY